MTTTDVIQVPWRACVTVRMPLMILTCMLLYGQSQQHGSHKRDINCQDEGDSIVRDKSHLRIDPRRRPRKVTAN